MITLSHPLILASASPRRKEILESVGLSFKVIPSRYQEPSYIDHLADPISFARELAFEKGREVFQRLKAPYYVLSADTIGLLGETILGKPRDEENAKQMLLMMSGKTHQIITALCLFIPESSEPLQETIISSVTFRDFSEEEVCNYLNVANYMDKAAAYAIQEHAAIFVERIEGDYLNIVGLPIVQVWKWLQERGKTQGNN